MFNLHKVLIRLNKNTAQNLTRLACYSTARSTVASAAALDSDSNGDASHSVPSNPLKTTKVLKSKHDISKVKKVQSNVNSSSPMVAAAFASLQNVNGNERDDIKTPFTDDRIAKAQTVDELLSISEGAGVSRRHALKVISVLAEWSSSEKIKMSEIESDPRFLRLCKILTKASNNAGRSAAQRNNSYPVRGDDLSTVLGVTADDEAAKLIGTLNLPQMVKVMSTLSLRKRRSTPLLRSLSYNISRASEKLDLKQCADLLYSMSVLSFPDSILLERIGNDLGEGLDKNKDKSAVIGSIFTSLGLLRYLSNDILEQLCDWVHKHHELCRPQDVFSLLLTVAFVNYQPPNADQMFETLIPQLNISDAQRPSVWIDVVWSLVLLNKANPEHISSVLSSEFIEKLENNKSLSPSAKLKVVQINAAAKTLISNYDGPYLNEDFVQKSIIARTKEKENLVSCLLDTLRTLLPSSSYCNTNVDKGWGFYIDAECLFDNKFNPILASSKDIKNVSNVRVALLMNDYGDICRGQTKSIGLYNLSTKILEKSGYKVLIVPYTEFNPRDKLIKRVQYLENKLKTLVKSS